MDAMEVEALRRQSDEALAQALADPTKAAIARVAWQMIIEGKTEVEILAEIGEKDHLPRVDLAEQRRAVVDENFRKRGFRIVVPKPNVSNTTYKRWRREGRELFYRPATAEVGYEAWMVAHGQGAHWTVAEEAERLKVGWEPCAVGYWFTAEVAPRCERLKTAWNVLAASVRLLSVEEYTIVWWTHRDLIGERFDFGTWCWLRTRFGQGGALFANDARSVHHQDGEVNVLRNRAGHLSVPYESGGGRATELVANAA